jgi:hypothetical protein
MRTRRAAGGMLAGMALALAMAGTAVAAPPETLDRSDLDFVFVDTEICPGLEIWTTFQGKRSATVYRDNDGNDLRLVINVQYIGTFTNVDNPDLTLRTPGHRHIEFDFVNNTYTDVGVYRSVSMQGSGNILLQAGRWVETLDTMILIAVSGPHEDWFGDLDGFCGALGG